MTDETDSMTPAELRAEKARAAANARWSKAFHPLFVYEPGERPEPIAWINIRRYSSSGPIDHHRVWAASELQSEEDIFHFFGGGTYELVGRAALPDGKPGQKSKTRRLTLEGAPKPMNGPPDSFGAGPPPVVAASGGSVASSGIDMLLAMMAEDRRDARAREERREAEMRATEERRLARDEQRAQSNMAMIVQGLQVAAGIVSAVLAKPAPSPPPPGPDLMPVLLQLMKPGDPLDQIKKVLEIADQVKPKENTESIPQLLEGLGQATQGIAALEQMRIQAIKEGVAMSGPPLPTQAPPPPAAPSSPYANGGPPPGLISEDAASLQT